MSRRAALWTAATRRRFCSPRLVAAKSTADESAVERAGASSRTPKLASPVPHEFLGGRRGYVAAGLPRHPRARAGRPATAGKMPALRPTSATVSRPTLIRSGGFTPRLRARAGRPSHGAGVRLGAGLRRALSTFGFQYPLSMQRRGCPCSWRWAAGLDRTERTWYPQRHARRGRNSSQQT